MAAEEARSSSADSEGRTQPIREFAYRRLARRAHSEGELSRKMLRAGYSKSDVDACLSYLRELNYVNDSQYANEYARSAAEHRYWGPARIARGLALRGVAEAHIEAALESVFAKGEKSRAERALARFRRTHKRKGSGRQQMAREYRHLLSRGYSSELSYETVTESRDTGDASSVLDEAPAQSANDHYEDV